MALRDSGDEQCPEYNFCRSGTWKEQDWKIGEKEVGEKYVDGSLGTGTRWEGICVLCILPEVI